MVLISGCGAGFGGHAFILRASPDFPSTLNVAGKGETPTDRVAANHTARKRRARPPSVPAVSEACIMLDCSTRASPKRYENRYDGQRQPSPMICDQD